MRLFQKHDFGRNLMKVIPETRLWAEPDEIIPETRLWAEPDEIFQKHDFGRT